MKNSSNRIMLILITFLIVAAGLFATGSLAAPMTMERGPDPLERVDGGPVLTIRAGQTDRPRPYVPPPAAFRANAPETATINVNYIGGWSAPAQAAFQFAVDIWETLITSTVDIEVDATWAPLGGSILGQAGATGTPDNFPGAPLPDVKYPIALANALSGIDLNGGTAEIDATFNSTYPDWYFGLDGSTPFTDWDFASVVLHELGHGLGFFGSMQVGPPVCAAGDGCWGRGGSLPYVYDLFAENGSGQVLWIDFPNNSPALAAQLQSDNLFFDGPNANAANGSLPPKLFAPGSWQGGSSYSHLDETFFPSTSPHALMTPSILNGEAQHHPGSITLGMFTDMGWTGTPPAFTDFVYLPAAIKANNLLPPLPDGGFEGGTPSAIWTEGSTYFASPICSFTTCGGGAANSGDYFVWFGGISGVTETAFVHQDLQFPNGPTNLTFWLAISSPGTTGFMQVYIDGNPIFAVTEADGPAYTAYTEVVVDVTTYADGGIHTLRFDSVTNAGAGILNFFVDDLAFAIP